MDTCNATERSGSRMYVCDRELHHAERTHRDVGAQHEWPVEGSSFAGETSVDYR